MELTEDQRSMRADMWLRKSLFPRSPDLFDAPLEVKERIIRREQRLIGFVSGVAVVWGAFGWWNHRNDPPPPPPPEPTYVAAGTVQSVTLHPTTFSTESTVTTTAGTFAVRGGVSAATGDKAEIKTDFYPRSDRSLCITSSIKTACYSIE